jgi:hypothetical protein
MQPAIYRLDQLYPLKLFFANQTSRTFFQKKLIGFLSEIVPIAVKIYGGRGPKLTLAAATLPAANRPILNKEVIFIIFA